MQNAQIDKHITYHCSRHTAATMLLTLGADIYTTSKLLGHANVNTTAIYARLWTKRKWKRSILWMTSFQSNHKRRETDENNDKDTDIENGKPIHIP